MQWQFLGKQELEDGSGARRGHTYVALMWRSRVPGGWLVMSINGRSVDPQPVIAFYPDADHEWSGEAPPGSEHLLRPAGGTTSEGGDRLLRGAPVGEDAAFQTDS